MPEIYNELMEELRALSVSVYAWLYNFKFGFTFFLPSTPRLAKSFFSLQVFWLKPDICFSSPSDRCMPRSYHHLGFIPPPQIFLVGHEFRLRFNKSLYCQRRRGRKLWPPLLQGAVGYGDMISWCVTIDLLRINHSTLRAGEARPSWCVPATFEVS